MLTQKLLSQGCRETKLVAALGGFCGRRRGLVGPCGVAVSGIVSGVFAGGAPWVGFPGPGRALLPVFPSFGPVGMVGEACLPSNAYYPRTPDYTLCSGVHVCWSEHSDSSFVYGFMILDYGFGSMTATISYFVKACLLGKNKKTITDLSSAELAQRVVKVKESSIG